MKIYLVGGAIRDTLLGREVSERDWCVVGADVESMLAQGFKPVGKDFPVFLHPDTGEEYDLARTERKTAVGYHGFTFHTDPDISIEQDLQRRDLTINAMAKLQDSETIIDPYGGKNDLEQGILRHVSEAFVEDPLRVLRLARFSAVLPDFRVADETMALLKHIVTSGEVKSLVPERVWQEITKAILAFAPSQFFSVLKSCGALAQLMPEIDVLDLVDGGGIESICSQFTPSTQLTIRFAAIWGQCSLDALSSIQDRVRVPSACMDLAKMLAAYGEGLLDLENLSAEDMLAVYVNLDAFRREQRYEDFLAAVNLRFSGKIDVGRMRNGLKACQEIDVSELQARGYSGEALGKAIQTERLAKLKLIW